MKKTRKNGQKTKQGNHRKTIQAAMEGEPVELTVGTLGIHIVGRLNDLLAGIDRDFSKHSVDITSAQTGVDFKGTFRNGHRAGCYATRHFVQGFATHWLEEITACSLGLRHSSEDDDA